MSFMASWKKHLIFKGFCPNVLLYLSTYIHIPHTMFMSSVPLFKNLISHEPVSVSMKIVFKNRTSHHFLIWMQHKCQCHGNITFDITSCAIVSWFPHSPCSVWMRQTSNVIPALFPKFSEPNLWGSGWGNRYKQNWISGMSAVVHEASDSQDPKSSPVIFKTKGKLQMVVPKPNPHLNPGGETQTINLLVLLGSLCYCISHTLTKPYILHDWIMWLFYYSEAGFIMLEIASV